MTSVDPRDPKRRKTGSSNEKTLPPQLLLKIFDYVYYEYDPRTGKTGHDTNSFTKFCRVSKSWYNVALPYLYRRIKLDCDQKNVAACFKVLNKNGFAPQVQGIQFICKNDPSLNETDQEEEGDDPACPIDPDLPVAKLGAGRPSIMVEFDLHNSTCCPHAKHILSCINTTCALYYDCIYPQFFLVDMMDCMPLCAVMKYKGKSQNWVIPSKILRYLPLSYKKQIVGDALHKSFIKRQNELGADKYDQNRIPLFGLGSVLTPLILTEYFPSFYMLLDLNITQDPNSSASKINLDLLKKLSDAAPCLSILNVNGFDIDNDLLTNVTDPIFWRLKSFSFIAGKKQLQQKQKQQQQQVDQDETNPDMTKLKFHLFVQTACPHLENYLCNGIPIFDPFYDQMLTLGTQEYKSCPLVKPGQHLQALTIHNAKFKPHKLCQLSSIFPNLAFLYEYARTNNVDSNDNENDDNYTEDNDEKHGIAPKQEDDWLSVIKAFPNIIKISGLSKDSIQQMKHDYDYQHDIDVGIEEGEVEAIANMEDNAEMHEVVEEEEGEEEEEEEEEEEDVDVDVANIDNDEGVVDMGDNYDGEVDEYDEKEVRGLVTGEDIRAEVEEINGFDEEDLNQEPGELANPDFENDTYHDAQDDQNDDLNRTTDDMMID